MAFKLSWDTGRISTGKEGTGTGGREGPPAQGTTLITKGYGILVLTKDLFLSFCINKPIKDYQQTQS